MRLRLYAIISVAVFGILYLITAVGVLFVLVLSVFHLKRIIRLIIGEWAKMVFLVMGKPFKINGKKNIDKNCRYILVANHASLFDIVAIASFYPELSWFGHERLLRIPLFGKILKMTDYIPFKVPTLRNTREMLDHLVQNSKSRSIAMFPEGTRTINGQINDFYKGFIYLFRASDLDILPVTLNGFYNLKPKNRSYINFSAHLDVVVHEPIKRDNLIDKTDSEIIRTVKYTIESAYH
jgi:1-acyl-sn-glycerol-3-phosphate acyltransferase